MDGEKSHGQTKYLFFYVGDGLYAIEALKTFGVYEITSLTHLVDAQPCVIGLTTLKQSIWPVIDLQIWLYGKKPIEIKGATFLRLP